MRFEQRLVLNQWLLGLFGVATFDELLAKIPNLKRPEYEGYDDNSISLYCSELSHPANASPHLPAPHLLRYDQNIRRHTTLINASRDEPIQWKYFQYLALLFTEIYLDRYFSSPSQLLDDLNAHVRNFNASTWKPQGEHDVAAVAEGDQVDEFMPEDLRKLALGMATGSGKTLLMHVNILQFRDYLKQYGRERELNLTILVTPNDGMSEQHLKEFRKSGIAAEAFDKDAGGLFRDQAIQVLAIHKLRDSMGETTVAVKAFGSDNLVLVDEGHKGTSGQGDLAWVSRRNQLCEKGFSFEYSATFPQAMKAAQKPELIQEYCKAVLFDYPFRQFNEDGYGKAYRILNLSDNREDEDRDLYLTGCLLAFYQQQRLYQDKRDIFEPFLLQEPLWILVGHTVIKKRGEKELMVSDDATLSDVMLVLDFLARFIHESEISIRYIGRLLDGTAGLRDQRGRDIFAEAFPYLVELATKPRKVFADILFLLFHAKAKGTFYVENLKGVDGEVLLRIGDNEPFGLINIGNEAELCRRCEPYDLLELRQPEFGRSHFADIDEEQSSINVLIGAKKFNEGWNSWRVSTMGLLNVGRSEGSEIIQLFGRGVRLKGFRRSLKRSTELDGILPPQHVPPQHIPLLETLNVFGVRSDYMQKFSDGLQDGNIPVESKKHAHFLVRVLPPQGIDYGRLRTIYVEEGFDYSTDAPKPVLSLPTKEILKHPVKVDWYPRIQARHSVPAAVIEASEPERGYLEERHVAFLDMDELYVDLLQFKTTKGWHNLTVHKMIVEQLLRRQDWYRLHIPHEELQFDVFGTNMRRWQEIAKELLRKYCDRYYKNEKQRHQPLELRELSPTDGNLLTEYRLLVDETLETLVLQMNQLRQAVESGELWDPTFTSPHAVVFSRHLYAPLLWKKKSDALRISPVPLDENERMFVENLKAYWTSGALEGKDLYLLRNQTRGKGIGFFEAGNFYPDFILWILSEGRQFVTFIDPKGIRNLEGIDDPKIRFSQTIKERERDIGDPTVTLNSCIISVTPPEYDPSWARNREQMEAAHVIWQGDQECISKVLAIALKE